MDDELEQIGIRAPLGTKARIQEHCGHGRPYRDLTAFILTAIDEKIDPTKRVAKLKRDLEELKRLDPEYVRDLAK